MADDNEPVHPAPRWFQRVVPTTVLGLALLGTAVLLAPGFRHQVELSVTRRPQRFLELYFPRPSPAGPQRVCGRDGSAVRVAFTVTSHLQRRRALRYVVRVSPQRREDRSLRGVVRVSPGQAVTVRRSVPTPRAPYAVDVRLAGYDERLHARCGGGRSS